MDYVNHNDYGVDGVISDDPKKLKDYIGSLRSLG
jgi:hypothetical protein